MQKASVANCGSTSVQSSDLFMYVALGVTGKNFSCSESNSTGRTFLILSCAALFTLKTPQNSAKVKRKRCMP